MGQLRDDMYEDLRLRNYSESTCRQYVSCARAFVAYHRRSPREMGNAEVRQFLMHLLEERGVGAQTRRVYLAGIKFLYEVTLLLPEVVAGIPWPKIGVRVPEILSGTEVMKICDAFDSIKYRTIAMTEYGTGMRISEVCALQVDDIDSQRMVIRIRNGKGNHERYVLLPERVLFLLRQYWVVERPKKPWLFPSKHRAYPCHVSPTAVRSHLGVAVARAGITKRVTPHVLRHSFATHLLELGTDVRVIQMLLGHKSIRSTAHYTRVTNRLLAKTKSPIDVLGTPDQKNIG
jgi:site-specific recombinase XerD